MDHGLGVSNWVPPASLLAGSKANPPFQRVSDQPHALPSVTGAWHRAAEHDRHWLTDLELQQRSCMSVPTRYNLHSWDWVALLARLGKDCSIHTAARRDAHISECVPCGRKVRPRKDTYWLWETLRRERGWRKEHFSWGSQLPPAWKQNMFSRHHKIM